MSNKKTTTQEAEVSQQAQKKHSVIWGNSWIKDRGATLVAWDVHPIHPWVTLLRKDGSFCVVDYNKNDEIFESKIDNYFSQQTEEKGKKLTSALAARKIKDDKKEKTGTPLFIKFFDSNTINVKGSLSGKSPSTDWHSIDAPFKFIVIVLETHVLFYDYVTTEFTGFDVAVATGNTKPVNLIEFIPYSTNFIFTCSDGAIFTWHTLEEKATKFPKVHSKQVEKVVTFYFSEELHAVSFSGDAMLALWKLSGPEPTLGHSFSMKGSILHQSRDEKVHSICWNNSTNEIFILTEREVLGIDVQKTEVLSRIKTNKEIKMVPFYHPGVCGHSYALLSLTQTTLIAMDFSKEQPAIDGTKFLNIHNITIDNEIPKHIVHFQFHPIHNSMVFIQTNVGITTASLELSRQNPSIVMTKDSYIWTDFQHLHKLPLADSTEKWKAQLTQGEYRGPCTLSLSPSKEYLICHWSSLWKYQLFRSSDMFVLAEGDARSVEWCNFKDNFVVLFPFLEPEKVKEDKAIEVAENDLKAFIEQKKSGGATNITKIEAHMEEKRLKREKKLKKKNLPPVPAVKFHATPWFSVRQIDSDLGRTKSIASKLFDSIYPDQVFGGTFIGLVYTAKPKPVTGFVSPRAQFKQKEQKKLIKFFSWNPCNEILSPMIAPLALYWDPSHTYCLFAYQNYFKIAQTTPKWQFINTTSGVTILSAFWVHQTLIYSTETEIVYFFPAKSGCFSFSANIFSSALHRESFSQRQMVYGPLTLVNFQDMKLTLFRGWDHSISHIETNVPLLKVLILSHSGLINEALKWASIIEDETAISQIFLFWLSRGYKKEIFQLNVSNRLKLDACMSAHIYLKLPHYLKIEMQLLSARRAFQERDFLCQKALKYVSTLDKVNYPTVLEVLKIVSGFQTRYCCNFLLNVLLNPKNPRFPPSKVLEDLHKQSPPMFRFFRALLPAPFDLLPPRLTEKTDMIAEWNAPSLKITPLPTALLDTKATPSQPNSPELQHAFFIWLERRRKKAETHNKTLTHVEMLEFVATHITLFKK